MSEDESALSGDAGVVGRRRVIDGIDDVLLAATSGISGDGRALTIVGGPGTGRTTMLDVAVRRATALDMDVLAASGADDESAEPYAGLHQLLLPLLLSRAGEQTGSLAVRVALGFAPGPSPDGRQVADAVSALLADHLAHRPTLLVIDDLTRLDAESTGVVEDLGARRLSRLAIITSVQAGRAAPLLGTRLALGPLTEAESGRLLDAGHPTLEPRLRSAILAASLGNPLAVSEIPRSLTEDQRRGLQPVPAQIALTSRLARHMAETIADLPADTRLLLGMHAIDPDRPIGDFDDVLGGRDALVAALPALGNGLVELVGATRMRCLHPVVLGMIADGATRAERDLAHRSLGAVLAVQGIPEPATVDAIASVPRRAAMREASAEATRHLGDWRGAIDGLEAAATIDARPAERARRLARAAYLAASVDLAVASRLVTEMRLHDPTVAGTLDGALAIAAVASRGMLTDLDMAHRLLEEAIVDHGHGTPDDPLLAEAIGELRWVCWLSGRDDWLRAYRRTLHAVGGAPRAGRLTRRAAFGLLDGEVRADEVEAAIGMVDDHTDPTAIILVAEAAATVDRVASMTHHLERLIELADDRGPVMPAIGATLMLADDDVGRGDFARAEQRLDHAITRWGSAGFNLLSWGVDAQRARCAAGVGEAVVISECVRRMTAWAIPRRAHRVVEQAARAELASAASRSDATVVLERANAIGPIGEFGAGWRTSRSAHLDVVLAARQVGRPDLARVHVEAMTRNGFGVISPRCRMIHLAAQALVLTGAAARYLFEAALAVPEASQWPMDVARIQYSFGAHLRRNHAVAHAREPLTHAVRLFDELGCQEWVELVRAELDTTIVAREVLGGPIAGGLTHRELRIAEAAASGMSNKAIAVQMGISARTVGNHLHHAYVKLGIGSRGGLRDALQALGIGASAARARIPTE